MITMTIFRKFYQHVPSLTKEIKPSQVENNVALA